MHLASEYAERAKKLLQSIYIDEEKDAGIKVKSE